MSAPSTLSPGSAAPARVEHEFSAVASKERAGLERLARRLVWDAAEAEDLVQLALTDAFQKWHELKDPLAAPAWLRRIVTTRALSLLRRRKLWSALALLVRVEPEPASPPDEALARGRHLARLGAELDRLSPRQRAAFTLRYLEGLGLDEVAAAMGLERGTARVHLQRAVEHLRARGVLPDAGEDDGRV